MFPPSDFGDGPGCLASEMPGGAGCHLTSASSTAEILALRAAVLGGTACLAVSLASHSPKASSDGCFKRRDPLWLCCKVNKPRISLIWVFFLGTLAENSRLHYTMLAFPVSLEKLKNRNFTSGSSCAVTFVFAAIKTLKKVKLIPLLLRIAGTRGRLEDRILNH